MWVPLHVHSEFSVLDSTAPVGAIAKRAKEFGMPAVALTDHGNGYGWVDFYLACQKEGIKPILGCELYVAPRSRFEKRREPGLRHSYHLGLLAKNRTGYRNLAKLSSIGFLEGFYYFPRIDEEVLKEHSEGLICLSGCPRSWTSSLILGGQEKAAIEEIKKYREIFGDDYYLELQRHPMTEEDLTADQMHQETWLIQRYHESRENEEKLNAFLIEQGKKLGIPVVATNDSHYMDRDDWHAHEILMNVQSGEPCEILDGAMGRRIPNPKRKSYESHEYYFKSPAQMQKLFEDCPEAISNTLAVAEKCAVEIDFKTKHYPVFYPPHVEKTSQENVRKEKTAEYLKQLCEEGIVKRYTEERLQKVAEVYPGKDPMTVVRERLEMELDVIVSKEMCDYLLIVWDFIHWAKSNGIPVGPGRGSGAGSIILYLIGVTDIEPLRFHLFFERFINPERVSYPDIDVDICMDRRQDVIQYTVNKYGKENVAQIITFNTLKARSAIKDVGRVLSVPLTKVNEIAKLVPDDLNITLDQALDKDPDLNALYNSDEETKRVIDLARRLEGLTRQTGIHAAGVIVGGEPLTEQIPVCVAKDSEMPVTQFSMKPVEKVGMLKMDFLGLKTLTSIQTCVEGIQNRSGKEIDWVNLPLDDAPTFSLLNQGKTLGVFQLESGGMRDLSRNLHLDKFEEIFAVNALYRPGPMEMIPSFIARKHGQEAIEYDHPWMEDILSETYGIMVYQEQVMQIANKLANFSLGEGDVLRRAMGKKDHEQMATQRKKFIEGCANNAIAASTAEMIFDKIEKFASYGFNKSHAAAYGYITYVTAYLKANYPKEWMAALMTCDSHDLTKVSKFIRECKAMQIKMLPPDVNEASVTFVATDQGVRFALSAIKGVGTGVVEHIIAEREKNGLYTGLYDFVKRIDTGRVGKKMIEVLVAAGAFDFTGWSRDAMLESVDPFFESAQLKQKEEQAGFLDFFAQSDSMGEKRFTIEPTPKFPLTTLEKLLKEKELVGFFLTGHPMDAYVDLLTRLSCISISRIPEMDHDTIFRTAFVIETVSIRFSSKSQRKFAILQISNGYESFELPIWPEMFEQNAPLLKENQLLFAVIRVDKQNESPRLSCSWIGDLTQADETMIRASDAAYDRAKHQAARFAKKRKENPPPQKEQPMRQLNIHLDAKKTRLSHILEIKKLFEAHSGQTPVKLFFSSEKIHFSTLHIAPANHINPTAAFQSSLKKIPSFLELHLD